MRQDMAGALAELRQVKACKGEDVRVDLRSVEKADSVLMATIVLVARRCRENGVRLCLIASASVLAWVELCRLEGLVELVRA